MKRKPKPLTPAERRAAIAGYKAGCAAQREYTNAYCDAYIEILDAAIAAGDRKIRRVSKIDRKTDVIKLRGLVVAKLAPRPKKSKAKAKRK